MTGEPSAPPHWRPSARLETLRTRAALLGSIRGFFAARGVVEVDTPTLAGATVTDPHVSSIGVPHAGRTFFLQTSPEYAMKRLLAAGSGPIYQICKAYRGDPVGRLHAFEFSMLEWYRPGYDHIALMDEVAELLQAIAPAMTLERGSFARYFDDVLGFDPHSASERRLREACSRHAALAPPVARDLSRADSLDLLFSVCVQPRLVAGGVLVYEYPGVLAALARLDSNGYAERFELFIDRVEIGNGYHELSDAGEQRCRMVRDNERRRTLALGQVEPDERLLAALAVGIGDVAGVAIGVDRLLATLLGAERIADVMSFADEDRDGGH